METAGKTPPWLMVPADAPAEGLGWAFILFYFSSHFSLSLSLLKLHQLSLSALSLYHQTLAGSYGHETLLPLPAPKEENGGERGREHRGKEARGRARRPRSPPGPPRRAQPPPPPPPPPPPLRTWCQTFPAPSRLLLPAVCACVRVCVCVCVCALGAGKTVPVSGPLPLENAKESLSPQLPLLPPAARFPPPPPQPSPKPWAAALPCPPLWAPLGLQSAGFCRIGMGDPGARSASCGALTVFGRPLPRR